MLGCTAPDGQILKVSDIYPFPPLPHYLPSESEIYGPEMEFVPATEAGWMISKYESSNGLNVDQVARETAAYIHFFRFNSLPPSSVMATSKPGGLAQLTEEFIRHSVHCEAICKRLQSEIWGLPSEDTPIEGWTFLSKVVLAQVTWHNGVVFLNNLKSKSIVISNGPNGSAFGARRQANLQIEFDKYKDKSMATLRESLEDLKKSGGAVGPDHRLRSPREALWLHNELKIIQSRIDIVGNIMFPNLPTEETPEVRPFYCELSPSQQMDIWVDLFDIGIAASIYWAVHPTVAIERNFRNEKGMGAVMLQTFCVAAMQTWNHFVGPYLIKDKEAHRTNILTTKSIKSGVVYDSIEEVVTKYFDSHGTLMPSIEAVIVARVTPRCTAEKRRRRNSNPSLNLPLAVAKRIKVEE
ncbi:hypothetical protein IWZ00DRAFT_9839 [Phyllosticta capitalensis]